MPSVRIDTHLRNGIYFLTLTVKNWYYLFDRYNRFGILADSLTYCQKNKGVKLYAYVFMTNHIHMVAESDNMIGFIRDYKKFTSKAIHANIMEHEPSLLKLFMDNEGRFEFWKKTNMPKYVASEPFFQQKMMYIHMNPVRRQYVSVPEHWVWSSANPKSRIRVDCAEAR